MYVCRRRFLTRLKGRDAHIWSSSESSDNVIVSETTLLDTEFEIICRLSQKLAVVNFDLVSTIFSHRFITANFPGIRAINLNSGLAEQGPQHDFHYRHQIH